MSDLLLKQELKTGESRTWKLKPGHHSYSFGSSRHADIVSISTLSEGIEAVFEFSYVIRTVFIHQGSSGVVKFDRHFLQIFP